eukprot:1190971-Prorocentrum_minimum.AAC.1
MGGKSEDVPRTARKLNSRSGGLSRGELGELSAAVLAAAEMSPMTVQASSPKQPQASQPTPKSVFFSFQSDAVPVATRPSGLAAFIHPRGVDCTLVVVGTGGLVK